MTDTSITYRLERPEDDAAIDEIHAEAFGPGRFARAAFRIRERATHEAALSYVAEAEDRVIASVRLTSVTIGTRPALLLGPLAVAPPWKGRGAGKRLVTIARDAARAAGHGIIVLVGDLPYYGPLGFQRQSPGAITLPGPVDPERVLVTELKPGALTDVGGALTAPR